MDDGRGVRLYRDLGEPRHDFDGRVWKLGVNDRCDPRQRGRVISAVRRRQLERRAPASLDEARAGDGQGVEDGAEFVRIDDVAARKAKTDVVYVAGGRHRQGGYFARRGDGSRAEPRPGKGGAPLQTPRKLRFLWLGVGWVIARRLCHRVSLARRDPTPDCRDERAWPGDRSGLAPSTRTPQL